GLSYEVDPKTGEGKIVPRPKEQADNEKPEQPVEPAEPPAELVAPSPPAAIVEHQESSPLSVAAKNAHLPLAIIKHDDYRDWIMAQLFMVVAGLIITLIFLVMAPQASTTVLAAVDAEPVRCGIVGGFGMFVLSIINYINGQLFHTIIWIPFGVAIAVL